MNIQPILIRSTILALILTLSLNASAQYANKKVLKKKQAYTDSIKQVNYPYLFPIWGQKAYKRGFDLPFPIGIMGNYIWLDQGIVIDNMQLGLETDNVDIPLTNVDEFIKFGENTNTSYSINFRPDIWVFPFLNVYGIFGKGSSKTSIEVVEPVNISSTVTQDIRTAGFGMMAAMGIGPVWTSVDANWTWNKPALLDKPVLVRGLGIRLGKTFTFNAHPDRNVAFWLGGMRIKMESSTVGQIRLGDALPPEEWDRRDEIVDRYYNWYDGLPDGAQERVDNTALPDIIESIEQADGDAIIRYGMDKQVKEEWSGVIGGQFQWNKRWMLRTEWGIIGDRKSALASVNYRFLL
jgi:hypothetical protein